MPSGEVHPDSEAAEVRHYYEIARIAVEAQHPDLVGEERDRLIRDAAEGLQKLDKANIAATLEQLNGAVDNKKDE